MPKFYVSKRGNVSGNCDDANHQVKHSVISLFNALLLACFLWNHITRATKIVDYFGAGNCGMEGSSGDRRMENNFHSAYLAFVLLSWLRHSAISRIVTNPLGKRLKLGRRLTIIGNSRWRLRQTRGQALRS